MQWLVVNTLFQEMMNHHNQEDGSRETPKLDPFWKLQPVTCTVNTSNNNKKEILEDLPEEQASQLKVKDFAARSKASWLNKNHSHRKDLD